MAPLQRIQSGAQVGAHLGQGRNRAADAQYVWLDAAGAMEHLGLTSRSSLNYHMAANRLPFHRLGNRLRFERGELDAWLLNSGSRPTVHVRHAKQPMRSAVSVSASAREAGGEPC